MLIWTTPRDHPARRIALPPMPCLARNLQKNKQCRTRSLIFCGRSSCSRNVARRRTKPGAETSRSKSCKTSGSVKPDAQVMFLFLLIPLSLPPCPSLQSFPPLDDHQLHHGHGHGSEPVLAPRNPPFCLEPSSVDLLVLPSLSYIIPTYLPTTAPFPRLTAVPPPSQNAPDPSLLKNLPPPTPPHLPRTE